MLYFSVDFRILGHMATLVERLRSVISSEDDDFFTDDTLLFYLNKSQHRIVSYMASLEQRSEKSLRALDGLRRVTTVTGTNPAQLHDGVYQGQFNLPTDVLQILTLRRSGYLTVREIPVTKLNHVFEGNYHPTVHEMFYFILDNNGTKIVKVYVASGQHNTPISCEIFYIGKPTSLVTTSTSMTSLPVQLENAVIYGAAEMSLLQESVKDPNNSLQAVQTIYQQELTGGLF